MSSEVKHMRDSLSKLREALDFAEQARSCIAQNRGPDKEEAREAYEHAVGELTAPLAEVIDEFYGDLDARDWERLVLMVYKHIEKGTSR